MENNAEAEYDITENAVKAQTRYKRFQYIMTVVVAVIIAAGFYSLRAQINNKIDHLIAASNTKVDEAVQEGKTRDREVTRYITCIFVLPPEQRTEETQLRCFREADLPGGLNEKDFSPYVNASTAVDAVPKVGILSTPGQRDSSNSSSSPNRTPGPSTQQPDNSQNPDEENEEPELLNCRIDFFFIHIGCPSE